jgi:predicted nuclease with TOPRIM domain
MKMLSKIVPAAFLLMIVFPALADQNAVERAQYMLRQMNAQKVQLEQQNAKLQAEIDDLKRQSEKQLKKQKSGNKKLGLENKHKDEFIAKLRNKIKELVSTLRQSENERLLANKTGQAVDSDLKTCVSNNQQLVKLNDELVKKYGEKGVWAAMTQAEPFTGIEQVKIENIMQDYRFKNEDLKVNDAKPYKQVGDSLSHAPAESDMSAGG